MTKKEKAEAIRKFLLRLYPDPPVPLYHTNPYTLCIAVLLSAHTTDKSVNSATPALFALAESLGLRLQGLGLPQQITDATPYVITLIALVLVSRTWRRRRAPGSMVVEPVAAT